MILRLLPVLLLAAPACAEETLPLEIAPIRLGAGQYNCTIKPLRVVELSAPVSGVAAKVLVRPGMHVTKGDLLVQFDSDLAQAEEKLAAAQAADRSALKAAEIRRDGLSRRVERLDKAFATKSVSASDYEQAQTDLATAVNDVAAQTAAVDIAAIQLERAEIALAKTQVVAPVDGVVGEELIDPGESTTQGPIVTLYVNQPLRVEAYVPSAGLAQFVAAKAHSIVVDDVFDHPHVVTLDYAAPLADLTSGTISVFFTLDAPDVLPGAKCMIAATSDWAQK